MTHDPKQAAELIRASFLSSPIPAVDPATVHKRNFLFDVCEHLGVHPSQEVLDLVDGLLARAGIGSHRVDEYPKMLTERDPVTGAVTAVVDAAGNPVIFNSREEEESHGTPAEHSSDAAD
jgi:hypothetical protein